MLPIPEDQLRAVGHVALACLLAGLIGLEREASSKPAGFRTHMLTGGAAALLVLLGRVMIERFAEAPGLRDLMRADPLRIMEAVIVGVSFIGAGTILKVAPEERVRYLTTAASILFSAGVGIAVALGQYHLAVASVIIVLVVTLVVGRLEATAQDSDG